MQNEPISNRVEDGRDLKDRITAEVDRREVREAEERGRRSMKHYQERVR